MLSGKCCSAAWTGALVGGLLLASTGCCSLDEGYDDGSAPVEVQVSYTSEGEVVLDVRSEDGDRRLVLPCVDADRKWGNYFGPFSDASGGCLAAVTVWGDEGSEQVFASVVGDDPSSCWYLTPLDRGEGHLLSNGSSLLGDVPLALCGTDGQELVHLGLSGGGMAGRGEARARFVVEIACGADSEFYQRHGGSTEFEMRLLVNAMRPYFANVDFRMAKKVHYFTDAAHDRYTTSYGKRLIGQIMDFWNAESPVAPEPYDLAVVFTAADLHDDGRPLNGIAAGIGRVCSDQAYCAVRDHVARPIVAVVMAHEVGHLLGATHCDGQSDCGVMVSVTPQLPTRFGKVAGFQMLSTMLLKPCINQV